MPRRYPRPGQRTQSMRVLSPNIVSFVCWIKSDTPRPVLTIFRILFLQLAAPSLSLRLSHLFSLFLQQSIVSTQWKSSIVTPVPRVDPPLTCSDYRPVSITPVLARLMEKSIVKDYLYPTLMLPDYNYLFQDQFAFRPSGSTTAALIYLLHTLTQLLQTHEIREQLLQLYITRSHGSARVL